MDIKKLGNKLADFDEKLKDLDEAIIIMRVEIHEIAYGLSEFRREIEKETRKTISESRVKSIQ